MRLFEQTKSFLGIGGRFDPQRAAGRMPACRVREITPADQDACISIYKENEAGHVPSGFLAEFEQSLRSDACLWLGVEDGPEIVGAGGIARVAGTDQGVALVFGTIRPDRQRMGYGTALLLARIASLPSPSPIWRVVMTSVTESVGFYKGFGFGFVKRFADEDGSEWDTYHAEVSLRAWAESRAILADNDVVFDADAVALPT